MCAFSPLGNVAVPSRVEFSLLLATVLSVVCHAMLTCSAGASRHKIKGDRRHITTVAITRRPLIGMTIFCCSFGKQDICAAHTLPKAGWKTSTRDGRGVVGLLSRSCALSAASTH